MVAAEGSFAAAESTFGFVDGFAKVVVGVPEVYVEFLFPPSLGAGTEASIEEQRTISVDENTRLDRAVFAIAASPGGSTVATSVATIRASSVPDDQSSRGCTIDFGRLVTVSGLELSGADLDVDQVFPWTGVGWGTADLGTGPFAEILTERLLVTTADSGDLEEAVRDHGTVGLPAQPTGLELLVDGTTVWFERQGGTAGLAVPQGVDAQPVVAGAVTYVVDRTEAVREALARARPHGGQRSVTVVLRGTTPGRLSLQPAVSLLHEHQVSFGASSHSVTLDAAEEGTRPVVLGKPFQAGDSIRKITLTVRGSFGPERVEPVDGPPLDQDSQLLLSSGRTMLFGIPGPLAALFGELQAVRLHLGSEKGGELAGRLLAADASGRPGEPVRDGRVPPVSVPPADPGWFTVPFDAPVPLPETAGETAIWLELVATYGAVTCGLTYSTDPAAPGAPVLRRLPGGGTQPLSQFLGDPAPLRAALRIVGLPGDREPRPAVMVSVLDNPDVTAPADPTSEEVGLVLGYGEGIAHVDGVVPLSVRIAAPGSVTLDDVVISYRKGTP